VDSVSPHPFYLKNTSRIILHFLVYLSLYGSTTLVDLAPSISFLIYTQSLGLLGQGISRSQGRYLHTEQHKHELTHRDMHTSCGIRTHDPSVRAGEYGSCLRSLGHCDRLISGLGLHNLLS
jgi:hypothetical protein